MRWLKIRHPRLTPPGIELKLLGWLPKLLIASAAAIVAVPLLARALLDQRNADTAKQIVTIDIFAIAATVTMLAAAFTVAIGCIVVHIMKGPAYVADPLPVSHADTPVEGERTDEAHH